ncbi:MAG: ribosomal protein L7/L12 [Dehalococcoidia bacterium]|nr:ribosomal protein L7/L12 [Dehalococcoidia bacterium]
MADEQAKAEVPEKFKSLVESIDKLSALELSELVKTLEERYGVSAAAPMMMAGPAGAGGDGAAAAEEKTDFTVELTEAGANKISVIKVVREVTGKGQLLKKGAVGRILYDSAILCSFALAVLGREVLPPLLQAAWGRSYSLDELEKVGMRILTLERLFNLREGLGRKDDTLPGRLLREPMADGPNQGRVVDLEPLKDDAYAVLGWDAEGRPTAATLQELGLQGL